MAAPELDAIVVGAGPAGASAAWHLRRLGVERVLVLDKAAFPRDKPCGSALTRKAQRYLEGMGLLDRVRERAYEVPRTFVVTPRGSVFAEVARHSRRPSMLVLNRRELDHLLALHARGAGAELREGTAVKAVLDGADGEPAGVELAGGERLRARAVVVAAGAHAHTFRGEEAGTDRIGAYLAWYRGRLRREHAAYMFYDRAFLPLYGWIFPEEEGLVNVGVALEDGQCTGAALRDGLAHVRDTYLDRVLEGAEPVGKPRGFPIHYSYRVGTLARGDTVFVGEAARLVEPMTGEGIAQALLSGRLGAEAVAALLRSGDRGHLAAYERAVRHKYRGFRSTRWTKKLMSRRAGWAVIEPVVRRLGQWERVGTW